MLFLSRVPLTNTSSISVAAPRHQIRRKLFGTFQASSAPAQSESSARTTVNSKISSSSPAAPENVSSASGVSFPFHGSVHLTHDIHLIPKHSPLDERAERQPRDRPQPGTRTIRIKRTLPLDLGGSLSEIDVNYAEWGTRGKPVVLICPSMSHSALVTTEGLLTDSSASSPTLITRSIDSASCNSTDSISVAQSHVQSSKTKETGWWQGVVGAGCSFGIDLNQFHVIAASPLGGPFGSTSPVTISPKTGRRFRAHFPQVTPGDQARAHAYLLDELGIDKVHAVVGGSMGGMQALCFAVLFPHRWQRCVSICSTGKTSPTTQALRAVQRALVESDRCWQGGYYPDGTGPVLGLGLARAMGTILYRSRQEFDSRFAGPPQLPSKSLDSESSTISSSGSKKTANPLASLPSCPHLLDNEQSNMQPPPTDDDDWPATISSPVEFHVESYLAHAARSFPGRYDANCWLLLSRCLDLMDMSRGIGGSLKEALSRVGDHQQMMLLPFEQDALIPAQEMQSLADILRELGKPVHFERLDSIYGHDAFLKEDAMINQRLSAFLNPSVPDGVQQVQHILSTTTPITSSAFLAGSSSKLKAL